MSKSVLFFAKAQHSAVLRTLPQKASCRSQMVVEIRNMNWQDARLAGVLRERNLAPALTDTSFVPRLSEMNGKLDLITTDFVYVRSLGDRKTIEEMTATWDKVVLSAESRVAGKRHRR